MPRSANFLPFSAVASAGAAGGAGGLARTDSKGKIPTLHDPNAPGASTGAATNTLASTASAPKLVTATGAALTQTKNTISVPALPLKPSQVRRFFTRQKNLQMSFLAFLSYTSQQKHATTPFNHFFFLYLLFFASFYLVIFVFCRAGPSRCRRAASFHVYVGLEQCVAAHTTDTHLVVVYQNCRRLQTRHGTGEHTIVAFVSGILS